MRWIRIRMAAKTKILPFRSEVSGKEDEQHGRERFAKNLSKCGKCKMHLKVRIKNF
jgi:hypothetical protein